MIFLDHQTTGDGILAGLQLVAAMLKAGRPLSELARLMEVFPQTLVNVEVAGKPAIDSVPEIVRGHRARGSRVAGPGQSPGPLFGYTGPVPGDGRRAYPRGY